MDETVQGELLRADARVAVRVALEAVVSRRPDLFAREYQLRVARVWTDLTMVDALHAIAEGGCASGVFFGGSDFAAYRDLRKSADGRLPDSLVIEPDGYST